jgi:hypothetical protein
LVRTKSIVQHMTFRFLKLLTFACVGGLSLVAGPAPWAAPGPGDSGAGPGGRNIGFDFNWSNGPAGYSASYISSTSGTGATLTNCAISLTATSRACDFAIAYSIGGVPQTAVTPGGTYSTWNGTCDLNPIESAPLTLFNCFNIDSFGQIFLASATGTLSGLTMPMTCLNPSGSPPTGLFAVIYQVNAGGTSIPATPLAQVSVDLSSCPTLTSWTGHTFSGADFAAIPINFSNVALTSGNFYAVYFGGLTPGPQPPGFVAPVPTLSEWGMILMTVMLVGFGAWKLRQRSIA